MRDDTYSNSNLVNHSQDWDGERKVTAGISYGGEACHPPPN